MRKILKDEEFNSYVKDILSRPDTTYEKKLELMELVQQRKEYKKYNQLAFYHAHEWQIKFHNASKHHRYRFASCANRLGKSFSLAMETAAHLTGKYDLLPWKYKGKRFSKPIKGWAVGITAFSAQEVLQGLLIGTNNVKGNCSENPAIGTGTIPKDCIRLETMTKDGARLETVKIKHYDKNGKYDGDSELSFKATTQGAEAFRGATLDFVWIDENTPFDPLGIYTELLQRVRTTKGLVAISSTPDDGETRLVLKFRDEDNPQQYFQMAGMADSPLYTEADIEQAKKDIPPYLHGAKIYGDPSQASGAVFPYNFDEMVIDPISIPPEWLHVCGLDLGFDDPTVATWVAMSPEKVFYVYDTYSKREDVPAVHAQAIRSRGGNIPLILPHDSLKRSQTSGEAAYKLYKDLLPNQVQYETFYNFHNPDGSKNFRREAGFDLMRVIMREDRLRIFSTCQETIRQLKNYKVVNGKVQDRGGDDFVDSLRYALLSCERRGKAKNDSSYWGSASNSPGWNPHRFN